MYAHVIRRPRPSSAIRSESLTARFLTCADRCGWQIIPTRIIILIEISHQIIEYVCKNWHLYMYNLCLSQNNGAKITTKTWVSNALELDIEVSCQCYTSLLLILLHCFKLINIYWSYTRLKKQKKRAKEHKIIRYNYYQSAGLITFLISSPQHLPWCSHWKTKVSVSIWHKSLI